MIHLVNTFKKLDGNCSPISYQYKDSKGKYKVPTNISITSYNDKLISNTRLTDYMYMTPIAHDFPQYLPIRMNEKIMSSVNSIQNIFDPNMGTPKVYEIIGDSDFLINNIAYKGLEDVRLVVWDNVLYGIGFRPDIIEGKVIPQLIEYNKDLSINRTWFINTDKTMEKNWQPITDRPFTFMYNPNTSETVTLSMYDLKESDNHNTPSFINEIKTPGYDGGLSGSSQLIHLKDGRYISICHTSHRYTAPNSFFRWYYNHYFVVYDNNLNQIKVSTPFHFVDECLEFCCGMCIHDDNVYISFSIFDGSTNLLSIPYDKFITFIDELMDNPQSYDNEPAHDYMIQTFESGKIVGTDIISYSFYLENIGKLQDVTPMLDMLDNIDSSKLVKDCIYRYLIIRRQNTGVIINKHNESVAK